MEISRWRKPPVCIISIIRPGGAGEDQPLKFARSCRPIRGVVRYGWLPVAYTGRFTQVPDPRGVAEFLVCSGQMGNKNSRADRLHMGDGMEGDLCNG
jgi:hypothetical protein